jgi:hypothetical protein
VNLLIDRHAVVERTSLGDGLSWVDVVRGFVPDHRTLFDEINDGTPWAVSANHSYFASAPVRRTIAIARPPVRPRLTSCCFRAKATCW